MPNPDQAFTACFMRHDLAEIEGDTPKPWQVRVTREEADADAAATVLNSFCFDYALRMRTTGTNVSFTYMRPIPAPPAEVVNRLPRIPSRLAWECGLTHITDDASLWPLLWDVNRAVAEAYGLGPSDLAHILDSFPGVKKKRPAFFAFLQSRLAEWAAEAEESHQIRSLSGSLLTRTVR